VVRVQDTKGFGEKLAEYPTSWKIGGGKSGSSRQGFERILSLSTSALEKLLNGGVLSLVISADAQVTIKNQTDNEWASISTEYRQDQGYAPYLYIEVPWIP
jgi:hypothetical protein